MKHKRTAAIGVSPLFHLILGALLCAALTTLALAVASPLAALMKNPTPYLPLVSILTFLLSGVVGGFLLGQKRKRFLGGFLPPLLFVLALCLTSVIAGGGHVSVSVLISDVCYLLAAAIGAWLGFGKKEKRKRRARAS